MNCPQCGKRMKVIGLINQYGLTAAIVEIDLCLKMANLSMFFSKIVGILESVKTVVRK